MDLSTEASSVSVGGTAHPYEDRVLVDSSKMLYAVADGVTLSSQGTGGAAAEAAVALLRERFSGDLVGAIGMVHEELVALRRTDRRIGETTITAARLVGGRATVANVGDSPAYLLSGTGLRLLSTSDKSPLGYITQVLGYPERIHIHSAEVALQPGDYLLLASDGIMHVLDGVTLLPMARRSPTAEEMARSVLAQAERRRTAYDDDKSLIVVRALAKA